MYFYCTSNCMIAVLSTKKRKDRRRRYESELRLYKSSVQSHPRFSVRLIWLILKSAANLRSELNHNSGICFHAVCARLQRAITDSQLIAYFARDFVARRMSSRGMKLTFNTMTEKKAAEIYSRVFEFHELWIPWLSTSDFHWSLRRTSRSQSGVLCAHFFASWVWFAM